VIEVAAQSNTDIDSGIVEVMCNWTSSLFDYDPQVHDRINYFRDYAWPIRVAALHVCCTPGFVIRFVKPVIMAVKSKSSRSRTLFHDVPEDEIVETLSTYGIFDSMLPTEMGGTLRFSQSEWIAQRRALEMEEIA